MHQVWDVDDIVNNIVIVLLGSPSFAVLLSGHDHRRVKVQGVVTKSAWALFVRNTRTLLDTWGPANRPILSAPAGKQARRHAAGGP